MDNSVILEKILSELKCRKLSRRALAVKAGIPSGRLSEILTGKRPLTPYYQNRITRALNLSSIFSNQMKSTRPDRALCEDELRFIEDWFHLAILNMIKLPEATSKPEFYASRLGISVEDSQKAIQRLLRLQLVQSADGRLIRTNSFITTSNNIPSAALRRMHSQMLQKSLMSLQQTPVEFRDISHIVMAINMDRLPEAKEEIRLFRKRMASLLEQGPPNEVYLMGVQLIPLSKIKERK